jgi:hypothetical protein
MRGRTRAIARTAALLAASLACAAGAFAQRVTSGTQGVFRYEYETAPERLVKGDTVLFILRIEGLSASPLKVDKLVLSSGLDLDTQAIRPYVKKGATRGSELRLGFYLREAGTQGIDALSLSSTEGWIDLGPIKLNVEDSSGSGQGAWRTVVWSWKAPTSAYRYEAFSVGLGRADEGNVGKDMAASFPAPADATVEDSGYLRWTVVALKEGKLVLPDASIVPIGGAQGPRGEAEAVPVTIKPIPKAISESKAIGRFTLKLEGPVPSKPIAGETAEFKLRLEGKGNFPSLVLPAPDLKLDGAGLGGGEWSSKREDDFGPSESGYTGSATLTVDVVPPRAGRLSLRFPPLAVLGTDGRLSSLEASAIEVEVRAPEKPSAAESPLAAQTRPAAAPAPAAAVTKPPKAAPAPKAAKPPKAVSAKPAAAPEAAASPAATPTPETAEPPAAAEGEAGAKLASLYGAMRRLLPFERAYREADEAALSLLASLGLSRGEGEPMLDALLPPKAFLPIALAALAASILVTVLAARRGGRDGPRRRPPAAAIVLALIGVAAVALAGVATVERFSSFAVVWTDNVRLIPSSNARMEIGVSRGSTARLRGESSGFSGLVFADGVEAWTPSASVFKY